MSGPEPGEELDPGEIEPTDNSTGAPLDLDRVRDVEEEAPGAPNP